MFERTKANVYLKKKKINAQLKKKVLYGIIMCFFLSLTYL